MRLLSTFRIRGLFQWGGVALVLASAGITHAAKNSPIFSLSLAGSVDTPGYARDVDAQGTTAYVSDWSHGLQIINASDPSQPFISYNYMGAETTYNAASTAGLLVVRGSRKAVLLGTANPTSPAYLSETTDRATSPVVDASDLSPYATVILPDRGLLALSNREPGEVTRVFDIANPSAPVLRSAVLPSVGAAVQDGAGLIMVDGWAMGGFFRADLTANYPLIQWRVPDIATRMEGLDNVLIAGNTVFVSRAAYLSGREICSVQAFIRGKSGALTPSGQHHRLLPFQETYRPDPALAFRNSILIIGYETIIDLVSFKNPTQPTLVQSVNVGATVHAFALEGNLLFVACGPEGMKIFRLSN